MDIPPIARPALDHIDFFADLYRPDVMPSGLLSRQAAWAIGLIGSGLLIASGLGLLRYGFKGPQPATPPRREPIRLSWPLIALVLLVATAQVVQVNAASLHELESCYLFPLDEWSWLRAAGQNIHRHHVGYYLLLKLVSAVAGVNLASFRLLSVAAFTALLVGFYVTARRRVSEVPALACTVLLAMSPYANYYAADAEPYMLLFLMVVLFFDQLAGILEGWQQRVRWGVLIAIVGTYLDQFYLFFLFGCFVVSAAVLLSRPRPAGTLRTSARLWGAVALVLLPEFLLSIHTTQYEFMTLNLPVESRLDYLTPMSHQVTVQASLDVLRGLGLQLTTYSDALVLLAGSVFAVVIVAGALFSRANPPTGVVRRAIPILLVMGTLGHMFTLTWVSRIAGGWSPLYRHLVIVVPFGYLAVGLLLDGLDRVPSRWPLRAAGLAAVAAAIAAQLPSVAQILFRKQVPDARAAWAQVAPRIADGDAFFAVPDPFLNDVVNLQFLTPRQNLDIDTDSRWDNMYRVPHWYAVTPHSVVLLNGTDVAEPFDQVARHPFIRRTWEFRFHGRLFNLYPDVTDAGAVRFEEGFASWPIKETLHFMNLTVILREAPQIPPIDATRVKINPDNDLCYLRGTVPDVFARTRLDEHRRTFTTESDLFIPRSRRGIPRRLYARFTDAAAREHFELSFDDRPDSPAPAGVVRGRTLSDGYVVSLARWARRSYSKLTVKYE